MPRGFKEILIRTNSKNYPVYLGEEASLQLPNIIHNCSSVLIVTDSIVAKLYLEPIKSLLKDWEIYDYVLPSGEIAKSFENYYAIQTFALENGLDRNSLIIALGGGVIGDIAGFVAATYMRGIKFIQVPTTLLAHDSAVGGKVAINHPIGKNMIGAFYQPEAVIYDTSYLRSLPEAELRAGFAEVLKHSVIRDISFFKWIKHNLPSVSELHGENLVHCIERGIRIKAEIVDLDEKETGVRALLNFGHTVGHALEKLSGYGVISHGDAVAFGMLVAAKISEELNGFSSYQELFELVQRFNYPLTLPNDCNIEKLLSIMKKDKKSKQGHIHMVLVKQIGEVYVQPVPDEKIIEALEYFIQ